MNSESSTTIPDARSTHHRKGNLYLTESGRGSIFVICCLFIFVFFSGGLGKVMSSKRALKIKSLLKIFEIKRQKSVKVNLVPFQKIHA